MKTSHLSHTRRRCIALALFLAGTAINTLAVDGLFSVTETWTATLTYSHWGDQNQNYSGTQEYSGTQTGTIAVSNNRFTLLNQTGIPEDPPAGISKSRTILYGGNGVFINGSQVMPYIAPTATLDGIFFLSAFMVKVPLVDGEIPVFNDFTAYRTSGDSLISMSGSGNMRGSTLVITVSSTSTWTPVQGEPVIVTDLTNQSVTAGGAVTFSITAVGDPTAAYQWQRLPAGSSEWINLGNGGNYSGVTTMTLAVTDTTLAMNGDQFRCVVSNPLGLNVSQTATLNVSSLPVPDNQINYQRLKSFGFPELSGQIPTGPPIEGSDGKLYGTTRFENDSLGTIFSLNKNGSGLKVLRSFRGSDGDGGGPSAALLRGSDGALYGTTYRGGIADNGTVFKLNQNGSGYAVLHRFLGGETDGRWPGSTLIEASDGRLYGTTSYGGTSNLGTIYSMNKDGSGHSLLRSFLAGPEDGNSPGAALVEATDGQLYGTTPSGGTSGMGAIFKLNKDGSGYKIVYSFADSKAGSGSRLLEASDGKLYGTTSSAGTVFQINKDGSSYNVLHSFTATPQGGLVEGSDGALYGTTFGGAIYKLNKDGSDYKVLHLFDYSAGELVKGSDGQLYGTTITYGSLGGRSWITGIIYTLSNNGDNFSILRCLKPTGGDVINPSSKLLEGSDGKLYGTAAVGGDPCDEGFGGVFTMNKDGSGYTLLHSFSRVGIDDAFSPNSSLVEGRDGILYGTSGGGTYGQVGTVYKLNKDGTGYRVLRTFSGFPNDNPLPGSLIEGRDGALYGTGSGGIDLKGTVFKLNEDGTGFTTLHNFTNIVKYLKYGSVQDGNSPSAPLLEGSDGALYGTTQYGGNTAHDDVGGSLGQVGSYNPGAGTVFRLNKDGSDYRIIHNFGDGPSDGMYPQVGLVEGADGALYGTTLRGGTNRFVKGNSEGDGTLFKLNKDGTGYLVIHHFNPSSNLPNVSVPESGLVVAKDGMLFGVTTWGGNGGTASGHGGTLFRVNLDGSGYTVLRSFSDTFGAYYSDGTNPAASLLLASDGALYGTTQYGGASGYGTIFKVFSSKPQVTFSSIQHRGISTMLNLSGGAAGQSYQIQTTPSLNNPNGWQIIGSSTADIDGNLQFLDISGASDVPGRFYRTKAP